MSDSRPILVTGGAGFIGSHLVDALLAQGYAVRVLDNLSMGRLSNLPLDNPQLQFIQGDVADAQVMQEAVSGCAAVAHLAAVASVQASVDNPQATHQSNFIGTLNLCEAMRVHGVKRVLFASSAAVYGNHGDGVAVNEDCPKAPLTPYAVDKLASEHYLDFYAREHALQPVVLRFFNIFGPRQDPSSPYSGVISIFTQRAQQGLPITVYGDGEQSRDFFYIDDLMHLLLQGLLGQEAVPEPVNVGWDQAVSLNQLLATISQLCGRELEVSYGAPRPGDIRHSRAANQRLLRYFNLPEATSMADGLRRLLATS